MLFVIFCMPFLAISGHPRCSDDMENPIENQHFHLLKKSPCFMIFGLPKGPQNHEKAWFVSFENIENLCFVRMRILREAWFYLSKTTGFEKSASSPFGLHFHTLLDPFWHPLPYCHCFCHPWLTIFVLWCQLVVKTCAFTHFLAQIS